MTAVQAPAGVRVQLTDHGYGKTGVRLAKVERGADGVHTFVDLTVRVRLTGDFSPSYTLGDNSTSLPTDTMRATVYALAADQPLREVEVFLEAVCRRLLASTPAARAAHADATVHGWDRVVVEGRAHPHAFRRGSGDGTAAVDLPGDGAATVTSGLVDLLLTKTTGSEYSGFLQDDLTVLAETTDRILSTSVEATWTWGEPPPSYADARAGARRVVEEVFATHHSLSVQQTLHECGAALLAALPQARRVGLRMPNRHHVPVDLTPFGRDNRGEVFVVQDRPYGDIEGTVERVDT